MHLFDHGLKLRAEGRHGEALDAWEKALALAPENRLYQSHLRRLRAQLSALRQSQDRDEPAVALTIQCLMPSLRSITQKVV